MWSAIGGGLKNKQRWPESRVKGMVERLISLAGANPNLLTQTGVMRAERKLHVVDPFLNETDE